MNMKKTGTKKSAAIGGSFGFNPQESQHHFVVTIPSGKNEKIAISEHFTWDENEDKQTLSLALGQEDVKVRVFLDRNKWGEIAEAVQVAFNQRLKESGQKTARWKQGRVLVERLFGKELTLLAWAIEDSDPALIPVAIKNWLGLSPEERWWLFTMTNAATGHALTGRNKGWRKAVRFALTENPVGDYMPTTRSIPDSPLFDLMPQEMLMR